MTGRFGSVLTADVRIVIVVFVIRFSPRPKHRQMRLAIFLLLLLKKKRRFSLRKSAKGPLELMRILVALEKASLWVLLSAPFFKSETQLGRFQFC